MAGCAAMGGFRAPKSRKTLTDYWWFCLDNAGWDFYKGMSPAEIEAEMRADSGWQRPTWPLGRLGAAAWEDEVLRDPLNILKEAQARRPERPKAQAPTELREPLATFGLAWPTTLDAVKLRYKELAKRHHPDANGGSKQAEERLKSINVAYAALRAKLTAEAGAA